MLAIALLLNVLPLAASALPQPHVAASRHERIDIVLHSPVRLTPPEQQILKAKIREYGWGNVEEIVRELYQDQGYFRVEVIPIQTPTVRTKALVLQVNPGKRYHLVRLSWRGNTVLSESDLAKVIPVQPGEVFNRTKFAAGLNTAKKLYESRGYINFTSVPQPEIDDKAATIAFEIDVDEGGQFHFGEIDVEGMEEAHRQILLSAWQSLRGRPYTPEDSDKFFNRYFRSPRPNIRPENYAIRKIDEANHSVNYSLQFVPSLHYRVSRSSQLEIVESP